ncbi:MAG: hypothetical protein IPP71_14740 [Bacteroidetes bacterium]|nr:hypothetical protein [Bacteroidota bacterium]
MNQYLKLYTNYTNTNKNSLALEVLQRYAILQEVTMTRDRDSIVKIINQDFANSRKLRILEIEAKEKEIAALKSGNEDIDNENLKMTRNTLLIFGILIGIAVLLLLNRFRALAAVKEQLQLSKSYLNYVQGFNANFSKELLEFKSLSQSFQKADIQMEDSKEWLKSIVANKQDVLNKPASLLIQNSQKQLQLFMMRHPQFKMKK